MYAGHIGVALGTHPLRRRVPLWLLLVAAQLPDWLDAGFCVADLGRGPFGLYTHGLVPLAAGALVLAALYATWRRDATGALLVAAVVTSHYPLDYITGLKPTWAGGPVLGLALYTLPLADWAVESAVLVVGWLIYRRTLPREVRDNGMIYASLAALLLLQLLAGLAFALNLGGRVKC